MDAAWRTPYDWEVPNEECPPTPPADAEPAPGLRRPRRLRRALQFARPRRKAAILVTLFTLAAAALGAVEPLVLKAIFDGLTRRGPARAVAIAIGGLVAIGVLRELAQGLANWVLWRARLRLQYSLLDATVSRLHRLPLDYTRGEGVGAVMTRLDRGIQGFVGAVSDIVSTLIPSLAYLIFAAFLMFQLDWRLTLVVLAFAPIPAIIAIFASPTQVRREAGLLESWARIYSRFNEVLSGLITVRSFAMEDAEKQRFLNQVRDANNLVIRGVGFDSSVGALQNTFVTIGRVAAIGLGAYFVLRTGQAGDVTVGTIVAFIGYIGGLFGPVQGLTGMYRTLQTASVNIDAVFAILDAQEHIGDAPDAIDPGPLAGDIVFENVRFAYQARTDRVILDGIDLHVAADEVLALVGPSGSGKSTLTALIQRLYDPQEGVVRIDGYDLRQLKQAALRQQIGVVLQDPLLFNDTIRNNIAYGRPDAPFEEIERVAEAARAADFIRALPQGYETIVGERGGALSVGERQRVAIARALLKAPPIVILDEATSALDAETEAEVQRALERLLQGRTAIVIAHRLATVVNADCIAVLRQGRIIEVGSHRDLMRRGGYYAQLVRQQTEGLLPDSAPSVRAGSASP